MSCSSNAAICCGIKQNLVQDCVESRWSITNQTPGFIYQANEVVSSSGTIEVSSATSGLTQVTITFRIGTTTVVSYTLGVKQNLAFTVVGFDNIILTGNAPTSADSAAGSYCLTPRYHVF